MSVFWQVLGAILAAAAVIGAVLVIVWGFAAVNAMWPG